MRLDTNQLDSMHKHRHGAFLDRLEREILAFMANAEPALPPREVIRRFDQAVETAKRDRIETEQELTRYCYLLCAIPLGYRDDADFSWMLDVLASDKTALERLDRLSAIVESEATA